MADPLRVSVLTISSELGGTERVVADLARYSDEAGIQLRVVMPRPGPLGAVLAPHAEVTVVEAPALALAGSQRGAALALAPLAVAALGVWARRLSRTTALSDADVLYTQGFKPHLVSGFVRRLPVVWHMHEMPPARTGWLWRALMKQRPHGVVSNSHATARAWGLEGAPSGTPLSAVIPNGVDLETFNPGERSGWVRRRLHLHDSDLLVGMPAVFARWKGQMEVVEAFRALQARHPHVHLVLVGGGIYDTPAERQFTAALTEKLRTVGGERIHRLAFQQDIVRVYRELDIVIHYSLRPEPFGRVVLEAMACGVPVIAAAEGGPLEIFGADGAGETDVGWLVAPRSPASLGETLEAVVRLGKAGLPAKGRAARIRAERFPASGFAARVGDFLRLVAGRPVGLGETSESLP